MREKNAIIICALICATLIICGIIFWPTLYRYDKLMGKLPVRMNRVTGYTEILEGYRWKRAINEKDNRAIPNEEIAKIEVRGHFDSRGKYEFDVYNGSGWTIKKIKFSIGLKDAIGKEIRQKIYETSADINPFSAGSSSIKLIDYVQKPSGAAQVGQSGGKTYNYTVEQIHEIAGGNTIILPEVRIEGAFGYKGE